MLAYICGLMLLMVIYLFYKWVFLPKRVFNHYAKSFRAHGYKVHEIPFAPYTVPFFTDIIGNGTKHKDALYSHKHSYVGKDLVLTNMLTRPSMILMNEELIKQLMSPEKLMVVNKDPGVIGLFVQVMGKGIVLVEGNRWKQRRKLLSQAFTHDFITSLLPQMVEMADQVFDQFENKGQKQQGQKNHVVEADLFQMMVKFTSSVVIACFLGMDSLKDKLKDESIVEAVLRLMDMSASSLIDPLIMAFGAKFLKMRWRKFDRQFLDLLQNVNNVLLNKIRQLDTKENLQLQPGKRSIIQLLLDERRKVELEGKESLITDEELVHEIITFFSAGSDTTSNTLTGMILHVYERPKVLEKLLKEVNSVIKSDKDITVENFKKMPYLDCVINEAMRFFSPVPGLFQREFIEDTTIGGVPVQKGTLINCFWVSLLHNPQIFQNPQQFIPERWEKEDCKQRQQLVAFNFNGGPRGCLGRGLAMMEIKIMMIKFLKRYEKVTELGLENGKRSYVLRFIISIKNSLVELKQRK